MSDVVTNKLNGADFPFEPRVTNIGSRWFMKGSDHPTSADLLRKYALSPNLIFAGNVFTCWDVFGTSYELKEDGVWIVDK